MAFSSTMISSAVGEKSMGKPAANKPDDVRKIQGLLKKVLGSAAPAMQNGVCDVATKNAIADFQRIWGNPPDSTVDAHGQTLKRLDRIANPLELKPISLGRVLSAFKDGKMISNGGGYNIAVRTCDGGPLPSPASGYSLHLTLMNDANAIDVTNAQPDDLMSQVNLVELLSIIEKLDLWSAPVQCRVQLRYRGTVISTSLPQMLHAPVRPHNGQMLPLDEATNGAKLTYQGNPEAKDFHGRMFVQVPGYDKYLFIYAGKFETQNEFRGFDCITYVGTACGASNMHMADSNDLAASLGATVVSVLHRSKDPKSGKETTATVSLEDADPSYVKEFFAGPSGGYFLMWSGGHIVLVADGTVHEFKASAPAGYTCTPVSKWLEPYKTKKLTVRRLPSKPARAA